jgi:response regulator RpfG family c-di-GMP phosphodiesterase
MNEKILFVDDDPNLLASCERIFRRQFQLDTAPGGEAGLEKLAANGPYSVVVSDRQMPGMDGIAFLSAVRQKAPDSVRILLTGNVDLEAAIRVVNEGNIFRFLTKPCAPEVLGKALLDAQSQYRLVTAERELLGKTLSGSIKLLTDILAMVETQAFGRAQALRDAIASITDRLRLDNAWEIHLAVMLASIGHVTVPPEILVKSRAGQALAKAERAMLDQLPETAARLLANIPRLEGVARIVRYQHKHFDGSGFPADNIAGESIPLGARVLKILLDMFELQGTGCSRIKALEEMQRRQGIYDPALLGAVLAQSQGAANAAVPASRLSVSVGFKDLVPGMILRSNVETREGTLILSAGHQLTEMTLEKILNFQRVAGIKEPILVENHAPVEASSPVTARS